MKNSMRKLTALLLAVLILLLPACAGGSKLPAPPEMSAEERSAVLAIPEGYTPEQVLILSRHHIRSPLTGSGSDLARMTDGEWFAWTSPAGQLSLKGGLLETEMGQFFRKYLEGCGFMEENAMPDETAFRFYANSKQRTIATAAYFLAGFLPAAGRTVEYHADFDTMDPVFNPIVTVCSPEFLAQANAALNEMSVTGKIATIAEGKKEAMATLEKALGFADSAYAKEKGIRSFALDDTEVAFEIGKEPTMTGGLRTALSAADALTLQYFEEADDAKAGFGKTLTAAEWKQIGAIVDLYQGTLFTAYPVAVNVAHPLLQEMEMELSNGNRRFSYLCGHDSNLGSVLAALEVEDYTAPDSITNGTPIGGKLTFMTLRNANGDKFVKLMLIYQDSAQLRGCEMLGEDDPPVAVVLHLRGMNCNDDGLYAYDDVIARFEKAIDAYNAF